MHANFQVAGRCRMFFFTRTFTGPGDLVVSCLWRQRNSGYCGRFKIDQLKFNIKYSLYFNEDLVCVVCTWRLKMAEILLIRRETLSNQSINHLIFIRVIVSLVWLVKIEIIFASTDHQNCLWRHMYIYDFKSWK